MINLPIQGARGGYGCLLTQGAAIGLKSIALIRAQGAGCDWLITRGAEELEACDSNFQLPVEVIRIFRI